MIERMTVTRYRTEDGRMFSTLDEALAAELFEVRAFVEGVCRDALGCLVDYDVIIEKIVKGLAGDIKTAERTARVFKKIYYGAKTL